jgi:hypothetical protein
VSLPWLPGMSSVRIRARPSGPDSEIVIFRVSTLNESIRLFHPPCVNDSLTIDYEGLTPAPWTGSSFLFFRWCLALLSLPAHVAVAWLPTRYDSPSPLSGSAGRLALSSAERLRSSSPGFSQEFACGNHALFAFARASSLLSSL